MLISRSWHGVYLAVVVLIVGTASAACNEAPQSRDRCRAYPVVLTGPHVVSRGRLATLASRGYQCAAHGVAGSESIYLVTPNDRKTLIGSTPVDTVGAFELSVQIPPDAVPGQALLEADGPTHQACPRNASCPRFGVVVTVLP